jgi:hypothetical protein
MTPNVSQFGVSARVHVPSASTRDGAPGRDARCLPAAVEVNNAEFESQARNCSAMIRSSSEWSGSNSS